MAVLMRVLLVLFVSVLRVSANEPCADGDESCPANLDQKGQNPPEELPEELPAGEMSEEPEGEKPEGEEAGSEDLEILGEDAQEGDSDEESSDEEDSEDDQKKQLSDDDDLYAPDPFTSYNESKTEEEEEAEFEKAGGYVDESLYAPANYSDEYKRRTLQYTLRHYAERIKGMKPQSMEERLNLIEQEAEDETTEEFFARLDADNDGMLSLAEWPLANPVSPSDKSDLAKPFRMADKNQDGKISAEEFPALLESSMDESDESSEGEAESTASADAGAK